MKTRFLIVSMLAALFVSSVAMAQNPEQKNDRMDQRPMMARQEFRQDFDRDLALSDEQKEAVKKIRMETVREVKPLRDELRELEAHQQTLETADNADMKAIYKNIDKISEAKTKMAKIMAKQKQEVRSLLTEEQKLKMDQKRDNMRQGERPFMKDRMENRMENRERPPFGEGA